MFELITKDIDEEHRYSVRQSKKRNDLSKI